MIDKAICDNCKYYEPYNGVCCCYKSEWVADFRDEEDTCEEFVRIEEQNRQKR